MKPIVLVGSINLDLVCRAEKIPSPGETLSGETFQTFYGGKGANQAVAAARLAVPSLTRRRTGRPTRAQVAMIGKVGDDAFGDRLRAALVANGIDVSGVGVARHTSSGVALITTDSSGQNSIVVVPGANGQLRPRDVERQRSMISAAAIVLCQLEVPLETVECTAALAAKSDVPFMLDPAPAQPLPESLLKLVSYLTPNETEAASLCRTSDTTLTVKAATELAADLRARGPKCVVIKMGQQGAYFLSAEQAFHVPAFPINCVDSTAAGDAFNGALAVALRRGDGLADAARFAAAAAALSVSRHGAQPSMPTNAEVTRFIRKFADQQRTGGGRS